jgi:hypothetical protein
MEPESPVQKMAATRPYPVHNSLCKTHFSIILTSVTGYTFVCASVARHISHTVPVFKFKSGETSDTVR